MPHTTSEIPLKYSYTHPHYTGVKGLSQRIIEQALRTEFPLYPIGDLAIDENEEYRNAIDGLANRTPVQSLIFAIKTYVRRNN